MVVTVENVVFMNNACYSQL